jgi:mono/diheme cytochrome c family protein
MNYQIIFFISIFLALTACSDKSAKDQLKPATSTENKTTSDKGIGPFTNVELTNPLDQTMVATGKGIYDLKCAACHKLSETRLVGPGFTGVTKRRKPEWIMNMITNVDVMLDQDPEARKLFEQCLTRMPNQNVTNEDARAVLEFFRKNDGES